MKTVPLILEVADGGRAAMHVGLAIIVLAVIAGLVAVRRSRARTHPVDRLDGPPHRANADPEDRT